MSHIQQLKKSLVLDIPMSGSLEFRHWLPRYKNKYEHFIF